MNKVGIKILFSNDMAKCIKIVRKYSSHSISEIRDSIINNEYVIEGNYVDLDDILLIIELFNDLNKNRIKAELFEHDRKTDINFLNNLVKSYYITKEQIREIKDQEVDE